MHPAYGSVEGEEGIYRDRRPLCHFADVPNTRAAASSLLASGSHSAAPGDRVLTASCYTHLCSALTHYRRHQRKDETDDDASIPPTQAATTAAADVSAADDAAKAATRRCPATFASAEEELRAALNYYFPLHSAGAGGINTDTGRYISGAGAYMSDDQSAAAAGDDDGNGDDDCYDYSYYYYRDVAQRCGSGIHDDGGGLSHSPAKLWSSLLLSLRQSEAERQSARHRCRQGKANDADDEDYTHDNNCSSEDLLPALLWAGFPSAPSNTTSTISSSSLFFPGGALGDGGDAAWATTDGKQRYLLLLHGALAELLFPERSALPVVWPSSVASAAVSMPATAAAAAAGATTVAALTANTVAVTEKQRLRMLVRVLALMGRRGGLRLCVPFNANTPTSADSVSSNAASGGDSRGLETHAAVGGGGACEWLDYILNGMASALSRDAPPPPSAAMQMKTKKHHSSCCYSSTGDVYETLFSLLYSVIAADFVGQPCECHSPVSSQHARARRLSQFLCDFVWRNTRGARRREKDELGATTHHHHHQQQEEDSTSSGGCGVSLLEVSRFLGSLELDGRAVPRALRLLFCCPSAAADSASHSHDGLARPAVFRGQTLQRPPALFLEMNEPDRTSGADTADGVPQGDGQRPDFSSFPSSSCTKHQNGHGASHSSTALKEADSTSGCVGGGGDDDAREGEQRGQRCCQEHHHQRHHQQQQQQQQDKQVDQHPPPSLHLLWEEKERLARAARSAARGALHMQLVPAGVHVLPFEGTHTDVAADALANTRESVSGFRHPRYNALFYLDRYLLRAHHCYRRHHRPGSGRSGHEAGSEDGGGTGTSPSGVREPLPPEKEYRTYETLYEVNERARRGVKGLSGGGGATQHEDSLLASALPPLVIATVRVDLSADDIADMEEEEEHSSDFITCDTCHSTVGDVPFVSAAAVPCADAVPTASSVVVSAPSGVSRWRESRATALNVQTFFSYYNNDSESHTQRAQARRRERRQRRAARVLPRYGRHQPYHSNQRVLPGGSSLHEEWNDHKQRQVPLRIHFGGGSSDDDGSDGSYDADSYYAVSENQGRRTVLAADKGAGSSGSSGSAPPRGASPLYAVSALEISVEVAVSLLLPRLFFPRVVTCVADGGVNGGTPAMSRHAPESAAGGDSQGNNTNNNNSNVVRKYLPPLIALPPGTARSAAATATARSALRLYCLCLCQRVSVVVSPETLPAAVLAVLFALSEPRAHALVQRTLRDLAREASRHTDSSICRDGGGGGGRGADRCRRRTRADVVGGATGDVCDSAPTATTTATHLSKFIIATHDGGESVTDAAGDIDGGGGNVTADPPGVTGGRCTAAEDSTEDLPNPLAALHVVDHIRIENFYQWSSEHGAATAASNTTSSSTSGNDIAEGYRVDGRLPTKHFPSCDSTPLNEAVRDTGRLVELILSRHRVAIVRGQTRDDNDDANSGGDSGGKEAAPLCPDGGVDSATGGDTASVQHSTHKTTQQHHQPQQPQRQGSATRVILADYHQLFGARAATLKNGSGTAMMAAAAGADASRSVGGATLEEVLDCPYQYLFPSAHVDSAGAANTRTDSRQSFLVVDARPLPRQRHVYLQRWPTATEEPRAACSDSSRCPPALYKMLVFGRTLRDTVAAELTCLKALRSLYAVLRDAADTSLTEGPSGVLPAAVVSGGGGGGKEGKGTRAPSPVPRLIHTSANSAAVWCELARQLLHLSRAVNTSHSACAPGAACGAPHSSPTPSVVAEASSSFPPPPPPPPPRSHTRTRPPPAVLEAVKCADALARTNSATTDYNNSSPVDGAAFTPVSDGERVMLVYALRMLAAAALSAAAALPPCCCGCATDAAHMQPPPPPMTSDRSNNSSGGGGTTGGNKSTRSSNASGLSNACEGARAFPRQGQPRRFEWWTRVGQFLANTNINNHYDSSPRDNESGAGAALRGSSSNTCDTSTNNSACVGCGATVSTSPAAASFSRGGGEESKTARDIQRSVQSLATWELCVRSCLETIRLAICQDIR